MSIIDLLFNINGRIGRLMFLGMSILAIVTFVALIIAAAGYWDGGSGTFALLGVLIGIVAAALYGWVTVALTVKRLHDLDETGYHLVWIVLLDMSVQALSWGPPDFAIVALLSLCVSLGVKVFLLTAPGTAGTNTYGVRPA